MITKLTKAQTDKFPEYVKKWTDIGLSTEPANRKAAEAGIVEAYKAANLPAPKIIWCGSPLSQGLTRAIVQSEKFRASVWASVRASVGDSVGDSVYGQHDAGWIGFYDYLACECGLSEQTQKLAGLMTICQSAGWALPHQKMCWVSERHGVLNRNPQGRLHKDGGAALAYPDGFEIFVLNGIQMKPEHVTTPAEKLDCKDVLREPNADVRRELIRKVGIERMVSVLPTKTLDKGGDYELLSINLGGEATDARFLKMLNPSIGVWHLEGVAPECDTIEKSLNWRNQQSKFASAEVLT